MATIQTLNPTDFEQVIYCKDESVGLDAIIALHDTTLGPGTGGTRMYPYKTREQALQDVLRLSKGMTYKAAISHLNFGGAKSVIIGNPKEDKTEALLLRFADFVNDLKGKYICAKDVGINSADLRIIAKRTKHILGVEGREHSSGDPSPATAFGVLQAIRAIAKDIFKRSSLDGLRFAIQGVGSVGCYIAQDLQAEGGRLTVCDTDKRAVERCLALFNAEVVDPDKIYDIDCDIFIPCAMGAVLNSDTLKRLKCKVVAGAANNQLAAVKDGYELYKKGIFYAPDYVINAGGLINIAYEVTGYDRDKAFDHIVRIYQTTLDIIARSIEDKEPPFIVADRIAEEMIEQKKKRINRSMSPKTEQPFSPLHV
jgi:leucine dehydrogenase